MAAEAKFQRLLATPEPAGLGPGPRAGVQTVSSLNRELEQLFQETSLDQPSRDLTRALVLLWHDHFDPAHEIAQGIQNSDGAFVHGILHRREPDYGNAAYWFRRVGRRPAFQEIAARAAELVKPETAGRLRQMLLPDGAWDPFGFISACESPGSEEERKLLRELQRIETEVLLHRFCAL